MIQKGLGKTEAENEVDWSYTSFVSFPSRVMTLAGRLQVRMGGGERWWSGTELDKAGDRVAPRTWHSAAPAVTRDDRVVFRITVPGTCCFFSLARMAPLRYPRAIARAGCNSARLLSIAYICNKVYRGFAPRYTQVYIDYN